MQNLIQVCIYAFSTNIGRSAGAIGSAPDSKSEG